MSLTQLGSQRSFPARPAGTRPRRPATASLQGSEVNAGRNCRKPAAQLPLHNITDLWDSDFGSVVLDDEDE